MAANREKVVREPPPVVAEGANGEKVLEGGALVRTAETVLPEPELTACYEAQYQVFRTIYPALRPVFKRMKEA